MVRDLSFTPQLSTSSQYAMPDAATREQQAASTIQRRYRSTPAVHEATDTKAPASSGAPANAGISTPKLLLIAGLLLGLNHAFNELMDDSGLHVVVHTAQLSEEGGNASALAAFRALVDVADSANDASETGAIRFELMEHRALASATAVPTFSVWAVYRQLQEDAAVLRLPQWLASDLRVTTTSRLRTVFPERSRWRISEPFIEPGTQGEVGRLSLLVQRQTYHVADGQADAFRHAWTDLGYNSLGEGGVVRCDLLQHADDSAVFVARKVFRNAAALSSHEQTEHFRRWQAASSPMLRPREQSEGVLMDTIFPRTSAFPFRSRWTTA